MTFDKNKKMLSDPRYSVKSSTNTKLKSKDKKA